MGLDIKFPIGLMFTILGLLLALFGLATGGNEEMYRPSLGININVWSGTGMLLFGIIMLLFSRRLKKTKTN